MLGGSRSDAEDVLQDVFLRAYHALRVDARPVTLRAWLYRVAHNRCIDQIRRPNPAAADIFDLNRGPQQDPMAAVERREDLRRLIEDVRRLPEQQRSALLMREMEGLSYNELADALGVTVPAIKSLLVRARIGLVEAIEARDTACTDIRVDIASAFDRGVRASGRSRKHLRECAGCRDYRTALRGIEKQLSGLAPGAGPLTTLAKILGLGGAGSGAAAGGGAAVGGGGAAVAGGGAATTVGTGVATLTATKVAAVVAAAAVVGGGAAKVEQSVDQHPAARAKAAAIVPHVRSIAGPTAAAAAHHDPLLRPTHVTVTVRPGAAHRVKLAAPVVAERSTAAPVTGTAVAGDSPAYEPTTGGLQAPDEAAADAPSTGTEVSSATGPSPSTGTTNTAGTTNAAGPGAGTSTPAPGATAGTTGGTATPAGSGSTSTPPAPAAGPSGQVAPGTPVAQGATAG